MPVRAARARRRALSLTSLIDVIFLLLLFFMLTSTFTRFSEIQLSAAGSGASAALPDTSPLFLRLSAESLALNGTETAMGALRAEIADQMDGPTTLLVSAEDDVNSQRLVDLLVALGQDPDLSVTVLE
ncbi:biopolymer transporter ExbD [Roseobacter sp. HKCCD9010]|uniref:biopolymer transporter ExbD n=1 Tax=unclassified Roseobacter TaxID=196798 RepID=UPI0014924997|nr:MULTISPECIES: biopolymer transporter ExbD [unclassified Roseobacter]MBF9052458.1 biopolymer transporter ExbD [Rhodobacterales bacterium HKCCD4356]NNV14235.1 biopolymer transporter ExbD [Roseobacter sp. HKCCD7357]NNV18650.1 biopolymer transporter ExbD [Roseobacter sp. HKCCD8768]NNV28102.1 biopolymer transporter ExbD [Roseobacter sp. HKCCD8192]NNV32384.1 biopolymer transporter ExbD [Roseobacter sp. HKCCD9061]